MGWCLLSSTEHRTQLTEIHCNARQKNKRQGLMLKTTSWNATTSLSHQINSGWVFTEVSGFCSKHSRWHFFFLTNVGTAHVLYASQIQEITCIPVCTIVFSLTPEKVGGDENGHPSAYMDNLICLKTSRVHMPQRPLWYGYTCDYCYDTRSVGAWCLKCFETFWLWRASLCNLFFLRHRVPLLLISVKVRKPATNSFLTQVHRN